MFTTKIQNKSPKSVLTTFEALFMQNAKQIITEKVTKPPQNRYFETVFAM